MIKFSYKGNFERTTKFLTGAKKIQFAAILQRYALVGVNALASSTPVDSSLTAQSWSYEITKRRSGFKISWTNSNLVNGIPVAILIQYGHATRSGSFVQSRDFINPVMKPIFDIIAQDLWKEVTNL